MISRIPLAFKAPFIIAGSAILLAAGIAAYSLHAGTFTALHAADDKLKAILDDRSQTLTHYLSSIEQDARVIAQAPQTTDAIKAFAKGWDEIANPERELQDAYIFDNPHSIGKKEYLTKTLAETQYDSAHGKYHPWFRSFLWERGYYDIFLFDPDGNLIYAVVKERDFATNLITGKYRGTDLGNAFRVAAKETVPGALHFFDFKPYALSNGAPASFLSTPIIENGSLIGVLAFQMPAARINEIMKRDSGLGETGETLIVGSDGLLRNDSRFSQHSTILSTRVESPIVENAMMGNEAYGVSKKYRDLKLRMFAAPFEFQNTRWALVAVMGHDEIMAPINEMQNRIVFASIAILLAISLICLLFARGVVNEVRDLVDARDNEKRAHRAKSEFLAMMSHEIRTPLNGILGMASALALEPLEENQRKKLDVIRFSGDALLNVLNDILDISRLESGRLDIEHIPFSLHEVLIKVKEIHHLKADEKGVNLTLTGLENVGANRIGDGNRITQILHNLVSNAIKFTPKGDVFIRCREIPGEGPNICIEVQDTGIGMTEEQLHRVFDPFEQADCSTTRRYGGSGLGLSIVSKLVDAMGGQIEADSFEGLGTTIRVTLNIANEPSASVAETENSRPVFFDDGPPNHKIHLLIAENHQSNQAVLSGMLGGADFVLKTVPDGHEAVEAYKAHNFDIVLLDIELPILNGVEALSKIRVYEKETHIKQTPAIAISALVKPDYLESFLASGFSHCVTKPIDRTELMSAIRAAYAASAHETPNPNRALSA